MARLVIFRGDNVDRVVDLSDADLRIGRGQQNDVVLEDEGKLLSRFHAELRYDGGRYTLLDLNSQNGLWVDGQRVKRVELQSGRPVVLGTYRLIFEADVPAGAAAPAGAGLPPAAVEPPARPLDPTQAATAHVPAGSAPVPLETIASAAPLPAAPANLAAEEAPRPEPDPGPESPKTQVRPAAPAVASRAASGAAGGGPIAWLAKQPKPVVFGGFGALAVLIVLAGQILGPTPQTEANEPSAAPAGPESSQDLIARHLERAEALLASGEYEAAIREHLDRVLLIEPQHSRALDLKLSAEERLRLAARAGATEGVADVEPAAAGAGPVEEAVRGPAESPASPRPAPPAPDPGPVPDIPRRRGESSAGWRARAEEVRGRYDAARSALDREDYAAAVSGLEQLLAEYPDYQDAPALVERARTNLRMASRAEASAALEEGMRLENAGDLRQAMAEMRRAAAADAGLPGLEAAMARVRERMTREGEEAMRRARQYDALGRTPEAVALYERAVQFLPEDGAAHQEATQRLQALRLVP